MLEREARTIDADLTSVQTQKFFLPEIFLKSVMALGEEFLYCGGPVTRLESQITALGQRFNFDTNVHATPSGLIVSIFDPMEGNSYIRMNRINNFTLDLGRLRFVDKLIGKLVDGRMTLEQAFKHLEISHRTASRPRFDRHLLCLFGIGTSASLLTGAPIFYSLAGGVVTGLTASVLFFVTMKTDLGGAFHDFCACALALVMSSAIGSLTGIPAYPLFVGTFAFVVPGLAMTAAISEVVDQNFISGTIRLLKAVYTFLAMALAYLFATEFNKSLGWQPNLQMGFDGVAQHGPSWLKVLGAIVIVMCFSVEFRAHRRSLPRILICGLSGVVAFNVASHYTLVFMSSFVAAFVIGIVSYWIGKRYQHPSQIYSAPSIVALVPGMLAFSSFETNSSATGAMGFQINLAIKAVLISLSIVFGLAAGRFPLILKKKESASMRGGAQKTP